MPAAADVSAAYASFNALTNPKKGAAPWPSTSVPDSVVTDMLNSSTSLYLANSRVV